MKIMIIRHGDPDYSIDSLTEKGWREAEMLSERIAPLVVKQYYVSPLGRARDTASFTLKKVSRYTEISFTSLESLLMLAIMIVSLLPPS